MALPLARCALKSRVHKPNRQSHLMPKFHKQYDRGNCGQIAVAVLTGKTVEQIEAIIGHRHGTRTKELRNALISQGYTCPERRPVVKEFPGAFAFGIIHLRENGKKSGGHWVAVAYGEAWDGTAGGPMLTCDYAVLVGQCSWHITAYMPVAAIHAAASLSHCIRCGRIGEHFSSTHVCLPSAESVPSANRTPPKTIEQSSPKNTAP